MKRHFFDRPENDAFWARLRFYNHHPQKRKKSEKESKGLKVTKLKKEEIFNSTNIRKSLKKFLLKKSVDLILITHS